ncbi:MAG TPA: DUF2510 domain-containing protein [Aeromicrobium sp.]|nr:DUF2510 domain-containing protein [Aeromicrobium sp.]
MANDIPAGWYPDIHGTVRWWDGERWTEHVRDPGSTSTAPPQAPTEPHAPEPTRDAEPTIAYGSDLNAGPTDSTTAAADETATSVPEPSQIRNPLERYASETSSFTTQPEDWAQSSGTTVIHRPARTISYPKTVEEEIEEEDDGSRRVWLTATVVGLIAFFLGMGIGGRQNIDPPGTSDPIPPAVNTNTSDIDDLRQQLEDRQAELDERQQVLDDREDELDRRASATPSPTPTATATATETEIDGNDRVLVGTDVREGTYRTSGPTDPLYECEFTISEDEFGDDPITDESTKTAVSVRLRDGDWFESDDCQDWERE